jgi:carbamoyltransferase
VDRVAIHLSHDSVLSFNVDGEHWNIELERIYGKRHYDARHEGPDLGELAGLIQRQHRTFHEGVLVGDLDEAARQLFGLLGVTSIHQVDHHAAHAAAAFYQSPFDECLVFSYDGGGNDGTFRTFVATQRDGVRAFDAGRRLNLGIPFRALAHPISDINKPDDGRERSNPGKLMGLAAYGEVRPDWTTPMARYFEECSSGDAPVFTQMYRWVVSHLKLLGERIGLDLSRNALAGRDARDLARTAQHVFETLFLETVLPIATNQRLPVCVSGGCALNVVANQRLAESIDAPVFVPPNPNDCGLAQGALLFRSRPRTRANVTYSGTPIVDSDTLPEMVARYGAVKTQPADVAQLLFEGRIVAVMRGQSEHGPRALGHRSILCNPRVPGMKARLNDRVKFRESFRPYAPVVRAQDVHTYFDNAKHDMSFMSFNPTVRPCWREHLAAAVHVDGTARAQTVTRDQNSWLFDVLTAFERLSGFAALVNTSFNSKGRPMVTRVSDALDLLVSTDLDCLVIEQWLFRKPQPALSC